VGLGPGSPLKIDSSTGLVVVSQIAIWRLV
jgi:hypothetical protein